MPPDYLGRYFAKVESGYQVTKAIREQCIFATHDLTGDPPFSHLDLVSCRNLLIYLGPVLQKRVIPMLHYALDPGRYLVLGAAETVGSHSALFDVVDKKYRIYRARPRSRHLASELATFKPSAVPVSAEQEAEIPSQTQRPLDVGQAADAVVLADYSPPGVVVNAALEIVQFRGHTEPYLRHVPGKAIAWPAGDGPRGARRASGRRDRRRPSQRRAHGAQRRCLPRRRARRAPDTFTSCRCPRWAASSISWCSSSRGRLLPRRDARPRPRTRSSKRRGAS